MYLRRSLRNPSWYKGKVIMKGLLLKQYMELEVADLPQPEIGPGDVLIRVGACGICGSDVHGLDGSTGRGFHRW